MYYKTILRPVIVRSIWAHACVYVLHICIHTYWNGCFVSVAYVFMRVYGCIMCARACECDFNVISHTDCHRRRRRCLSSCCHFETARVIITT